MKYFLQTLLFPTLVGILFSVGLSISGMVNPNIVKNFLDIFGNWDPSLLFVMGAAVCINFYPFLRLKRHEKTIFGSKIEMPTNTNLDSRLILGAAIFGIGWGLSGICPGPAVANLFLLEPNLYFFFTAMIVGMWTFKGFFEN